MKYYKGCRPLGIEKDSEGIAWNLIECDMSLFGLYANILPFFAKNFNINI